jgi:hypothetical protein
MHTQTHSNSSQVHGSDSQSVSLRVNVSQTSIPCCSKRWHHQSAGKESKRKERKKAYQMKPISRRLPRYSTRSEDRYLWSSARGGSDSVDQPCVESHTSRCILFSSRGSNRHGPSCNGPRAVNQPRVITVTD